MRCGKVRKQKVVYRNGKVGLTRIRAGSVDPTETVHVHCANRKGDLRIVPDFF